MSGHLLLFSYRRCPFAIRVRMTLEEKGVAYQVREEDLAHPSAELLAFNPQGTVPVLKIGDQVFIESAVITELLEELFPSVRLMPSSPYLRAQVRLWTRWCDHEFKPDLDLYKYDWKSLGDQEKGALQERFRSHFQKLEKVLQGANFLVGAELTLADIHVFPFIRQWTRVPRPQGCETELPAGVQRWLESLLSRPAFERVMAKRVE